MKLRSILIVLLGVYYEILKDMTTTPLGDEAMINHLRNSLVCHFQVLFGWGSSKCRIKLEAPEHTKADCFCETWLSSLPFLEGFSHDDCQCDFSLARLSSGMRKHKDVQLGLTLRKVRADLSRNNTELLPFAPYLAVLIETNLLSVFSYTFDSFLAEISSGERQVELGANAVLFRFRFQRLLKDAMIGEDTEASTLKKAAVFRVFLLGITTRLFRVGAIPDGFKLSLLHFNRMPVLFYFLLTHSFANFGVFWRQCKGVLENPEKVNLPLSLRATKYQFTVAFLEFGLCYDFVCLITLLEIRGLIAEAEGRGDATIDMPFVYIEYEPGKNIRICVGRKSHAYHLPRDSTVLVITFGAENHSKRLIKVGFERGNWETVTSERFFIEYDR